MNIIRVYEKNETSFNHNGIQIIKPLTCIITRSLFDYQYFVELTYPLYSDEKWKELTEERILRIYDERFDDFFRIKTVRRTNSEVYVYADHIFFDLNNNFIEDTNIVQKNGVQAINQILSNTQYGHHFSGTSDIKTINNARIVRYNVISALLGSEDNTFISRWGGELDMNKFTFKINSKIGIDRGYLISYGKNLTSIECETNMSSVVTRIMPIGYDGIMLNEKYVDSKYVDNYTFPIIKEIKYEAVKWKGSPNYSNTTGKDDGAFETLEEAQNELRRLANLEFTESNIDLPSVTYNINFIDLAKTEEYKNFVQLLIFDIGDTITIRHKKLGINLKARIIGYNYNCLTEQFENMVLGNYKQSYFNQSSELKSELDNIVTKLPGTMNSLLQNSKNEATNLINSALGGYVVKTNSELLIMDTDNIDTARRIWRWNINGLGYSSTGYHGMFTTAMTMNGSINCDFLDSGIIKAELIKSGILSSLNNATEINMQSGAINIKNPITNESVFSVTNGNLTAEGSISTGSSGNRIIVSDSSYKIYSNNTYKAFFGLKNDDTYVSPMILFSADEVGNNSYDSFSINMYKRNNNPSNYSFDYMDMVYYCSDKNHYSNMKMFGDGNIRIAPIKDLEISTNFYNGDYDNPNGYEHVIAKFFSSDSDYYGGCLQIDSVTNTNNINGLILEDIKNNYSCGVAIYANHSSGEKSFRPLPSQSGDIYCGTSNALWKAVFSANGTIQTSDSRYKAITDNTNIQDCFNMVKNIKIYNYVMLDKNKEKMSEIEYIENALVNVGNETSVQMGVMAQDLLKYDCGKQIVIHENIKNEETNEIIDDIYNINAYPFATAVAGALQYEISERESLKKEIDELRNKNEELENRLKILEEKGGFNRNE